MSGNISTCLSDMQLGDHCKVTGIRRGEKAYRQKLLAMGLTPGTEFSVTRYAPMGDPVEIKVRGFALSLRQAEANTLLVEKVES
ncbi:MAG: FeoA family protein [Thiotrichaceae bacterium]|nr:FeoA family protein [Thiotrichaceae bacterium]